MVTKEGIIKIIDFGLGVLATSDDFDRIGHAGTVGFIAPEVEKRKPCTTASDMWAVGMMLQMCMDGVHPADRLAIKTPGVSKDPIHYVPTLSKGGLPLSLCGVLHKCQTIDPDFRASASDLLKGEFFQRDYDRQDLVKLFKPRRSFKKILSKAKAYLRRLL
ncbi:Serine/threonine-protein kinase PAK 5 [Tulasnella sp. 418]|nr:Serine/threonine-protein kinase PAK 5 [Tulasnella sp. 418]